MPVESIFMQVWCGFSKSQFLKHVLSRDSTSSSLDMLAHLKKPPLVTHSLYKRPLISLIKDFFLIVPTNIHIL